MDKLRECQKEATQKFEDYFYVQNDGQNDRGIISMCCGSGKSRTSYEIIKKCIKKNEKFFVIATSRVKLIYQLANDYIKWSKLEKINLTIKVVGGSGEEYKKLTLQNEDDIKNCIKSRVCLDKNPLLIITTYNSCNKIINAVNGDSELHPNLIILDEAHNTTGENSKINQGLIAKDNDKISSHKYLFMTATPVELLLKNKKSLFQNNETVFSMSNKTIYGEIIYEYSFYNGFEDKILVPFSTIHYSKLDEIPYDIKKELVNKNKIEKQHIYFKTISTFLVDNIKDYNLKHVLVYLQNQEKIDIMERILKDLISEDNLQYNIYNIHSKQSKKTRDTNLENFRKPETNVLLSVGIFNEGVDEPCIDAVMFAEERNTQTCIVQNIGRCLRTDKNNRNKKKSYVLIPNIVYEFNDDNEMDINKTYSSHFKMIRYVASVMKNDVEKHFYKKYVKGDMPDDSDEDDKDINDMCDDYEYIQSIQSIQGDKLEFDLKNTLDLSKYFKRECTNENINNEELETIKKIVRIYKIINLTKYGKFARIRQIPYIYLHEDFRTEWISWSYFLQDNVYTYEEAKNCIAKNFKNKFNNSKEWVDYYHTLIKNELDDNRHHKVTDELVNDIIKIPNRPKEYYKGEWKDWNDFLGLTSDHENTILIKTDAEVESKADKNIKVLMNNDDKKVKLVKGDYNDIALKTDLSDIKKYIGMKLNIDCILQPKVCLKNNGNYDKCCIHCKTKENDNSIPIIIYPEENKFKYDRDNLHVKGSKMNRTKDMYVSDEKILKQFHDIIEECRKYVNEMKKNGDVIVDGAVADENNEFDDIMGEFVKDNMHNKENYKKAEGDIIEKYMKGIERRKDKPKCIIVKSRRKI